MSSGICACDVVYCSFSKLIASFLYHLVSIVKFLKISMSCFQLLSVGRSVCRHLVDIANGKFIKDVILNACLKVCQNKVQYLQKCFVSYLSNEKKYLYILLAFTSILNIRCHQQEAKGNCPNSYYRDNCILQT